MLRQAITFLHLLLLLPGAVSVSAAAEEMVVVDFENDLQPILTRFGCNSGPCHGKARGQGGFQLSLLGFDAQQDYDAIAKEGRGRRTFAGAPESSLILAKPAGKVPHGGGRNSERKGSHRRHHRGAIDREGSERLDCERDRERQCEAATRRCSVAHA